MQDGTQEGNEAYVISHRSARSRGYKRREGARARARERVSACVRLCLSVNVLRRRVSHLSSSQPLCVNVHLCERECCIVSVVTCLRKALDIPSYRYKEMSSCTMGCSYVLSWLAEKRLESCTRANVAVGEVH
jgi:hypothetical protein